MSAKSRTAYFTKRGYHFGNLWSVYSLKTNQVIQLGSDRQLAHWLLYLEFSPSVVNFRFDTSSKTLASNMLSKLDYHFEVMPVEGMPELHYLRTVGHSINYIEKVQSAALIKYKYIEFNDEDWLPQKEKILPLLKVSNFLNGGRHVYISPQLNEDAVGYVVKARKGALGGYLSSLCAFDSNLCLLVFCRMYSERKINVDFESNFFSRNTLWWINE
ncbi:hypothetical protein PH586_07545 [Pseudomonas sp. SA3-5]|uniref:Uncharacterized protein n=1 Tax=Pseudomonas aestuarii TaxID=3018340 RepID=A0ABT4XDH1_9PSED|nr:hypothetical protein [Pseudomonas aestuarii]MDA7086232.1 hypothetical protein [Pseudomonas aestuarii]